MVVAAIAMLTILLADFQEDASAEAASSTAMREAVQAEYFARSAVALSRLLVASEPTVRQAIAPMFMMMRRTPPQLPVWEFSDRILGAFNDEEGAKDFSQTSGLNISGGKNLGLKGGKFEVVIVDEDSKINVNMGAANEIAHIRLARQLMAHFAPIQYSPLFERRDESGNYHDRKTVCAALIDWADLDDNFFSCDLSTSAPSGGAAEDVAYYRSLPKPYHRKNAPYDSVEELHLVRGVDDDFWTTFIDPEPENPKKRKLTVWGQGTVNVNTADAVTLFSMVCSGAPQSDLCTDPAQMPLFITGVTMAQGISMGAPIFGSPADFINTMKGQGMIGPMLSTLGLKPVKFQSDTEFAKSISTESKVFSVYAVGVVKGVKRETRTKIHAVVDFRQAPSVTSPAPGVPGQTGGQPGATSGVTTPGGTGGQPNAVAAALAPSTGGEVLYYRVE